MYYASWPVGRLGSSRGGGGGRKGKQAGRQGCRGRGSKEFCALLLCRREVGRRGRGGWQRCSAVGGGRDPAAAGKQQEVFANLLLLLPR